jgi:hypothetical protein
MQRHEIPTHLGVEDRAFLGLTMRQLMTAAVGLAVAYGAVTELPLPAPLQFAIAGVVMVAAGLLTLWQPAGRPLEAWAFVFLRYYATPRIAVWRPVSRTEAEDQQHEPPAAVVRLPVSLPATGTVIASTVDAAPASPRRTAWRTQHDG